jgi:hypothetical protein
MPAELPYMPSTANVSKILDKIRAAATPARFTHDFLKSNLGFSSSNDRAVIKVLRQLDFLSDDGTPKDRYNQFRGQQSGQALAEGLRAGWAPLFLSDEHVYERSNAELIDIVKNVTGSGDAVATKIARTFKALAERADWKASGAGVDPTESATSDDTSLGATGDAVPTVAAPITAPLARSFQLHHDIHIHLPPTSDVGVYRAIFKAMKSELM